MELLRDKPEFKETIEGNIFLLQDIESIIENVDVEVDFAGDKDEMITNILDCINKNVCEIKIGDDFIGESISDKQILVIAIFEILEKYTGEVEVINKKEITLEIIDKMSDFVKENYGLSIKESYLQTQSLM